MIYGNKFVWWTGVVEDRNDPEQLGRCRVRIFGFHTDDITLLPTSDLPWAILLQSVTSAATSGLGQTPVGIVPGTWVVGWFLDGEEAQRPLIIGTIAGKPEKQPEAIKKQTQEKSNSTTNIVRSGDGNPVVDQDNKPITTKGQIDRTAALYPLTSDDLKNIFSTIAEKASGNNLAKESMDGRLGKYQLSVQTLVSLGYVKRPGDNFGLTVWTDNNSNWTGKDGIYSKAAFLKSESAQYNAVLSATETNYKSLIRLGKITQQDDSKIVGALLGTSLIMGANNSDKLNKKNEDGVLAKDYFIAVNSALGGSSDDFTSDIEQSVTYLADTNNNNYQGVLNNKELLKRRGFSDPNKDYPKYEYLGLPDLNKLALGDMTHLSFKIKENKKVENIPLPNTSQTWNEPRPSFGARYPFNQVLETEAGHVVELDSTPGAERIHVFHKSGSYIEIDVNGSMVRKVIGDNYEIIDRNNFKYVKGSHCLTVEGKMSMLVRNGAQIVVEGDLSVTSHKDTSISTSGTATIAAKNINVSSVESMNLITDGALNLQGKNINLYAKGGSISQKAGEDISMQTGAAGTMSIKAGQALLMDAAIVKTKMGANSIREIAFSSLPLPEVKAPDTKQISVLPRDIVPESTLFFDALETGPEVDKYVAAKQENGEINSNLVFAEIPKETVPADIVKTISVIGDTGVVTSTVTTSNTITKANVVATVVKNTNQIDEITNIVTSTAANVASAISAATNQINTKVTALASDTIDTSTQILDNTIKRVKSLLPSSKW